MIILTNGIIGLLLYIYVLTKNIKLKIIVEYLSYIALIFLISYFIAFRGLDAGNDTPNYVNAYSQISSFLSSYIEGSSIFGSKEPLFWYWSGALKSFFHFSAQEWLVSNAMFSFILFYITYKSLGKELKIDIFIPFMLLFFTYFFVVYGNIMRQMIAVPFVFLAIVSFQNKNYIVFLVFSLFAVGFHVSAVVLFLYPIYEKIHLKYWILLLLSTLFVIFGAIIIGKFLSVVDAGYLLEKWNLYTTSYVSPYGSMFQRPTFILTLITLIFYIIIYRKENYSDVLFSANLFFIFILIATSFNSGIAERFIVYIYFLLPISLWKMILFIHEKYQQKLIQLLVILLFYLQSIYIFSKQGVLYTLGIHNGGIF